MKKLLFLPLVALLIMGATASAQTLKIGHIDTNQLLRVMPGRQEAQTQLEAHARDLETKFTAMQTELQTKYTDYLANESTFSEPIRTSMQREISSLQERIQEFQELAQQDLAQTESRLLSPIVEAARKAIEDVAKENGYSYILDTSGGAVLYFPPSDDIMSLVRTKLGIN